MQQNNCNSDSCVDLTKPAVCENGPRPCKGIAPVGIRWCQRKDGWPADSIVFTNCSFYYNNTGERNYKNPDMYGSGWLPFETGVLMDRVINSYAFEGYDAQATYIQDACIIDCGLWRKALIDNPTVSPECSDKLPEEQRQWSDKMTMCALIKTFVVVGPKGDTGDTGPVGPVGPVGPAGADADTTFTQGLDDATGKLTSTVGDTTNVVNVADPSLFPSGAIHAVDGLPTPLGTGDIDPVPLYRDGTEEASGGVTVSDTGITLPKAGRWHIHIRVLAQLHDVSNNLVDDEITRVQLIQPDGEVATAIKYERADFIAIPEAQDKREINQKHITKFLEAGEYHWLIENTTAKVNINSIQSDFIFISNETDEN